MHPMMIMAVAREVERERQRDGDRVQLIAGTGESRPKR